jgi:hypothetical protein
MPNYDMQRAALRAASDGEAYAATAESAASA